MYYILTALIVTFLLYFRNGIGAGLYIAVKNWRQSGFIAACVLGGLLIGVSLSDRQPDFATITHLIQPEDRRTAARIADCKEFVEARLHNRPYGEVDRAMIDLGVIRIGTTSYWDSCARTFGMNYWKHDITIDGRNGGHVLCDLYRNTPYKSGDVDAWCTTVFAPDPNA